MEMGKIIDGAVRYTFRVVCPSCGAVNYESTSLKSDYGIDTCFRCGDRFEFEFDARTDIKPTTKG